MSNLVATRAALCAALVDELTIQAGSDVVQANSTLWHITKVGVFSCVRQRRGNSTLYGAVIALADSHHQPASMTAPDAKSGAFLPPPGLCKLEESSMSR